MTFLLPLPLALLDTFTSHSFFFMCVCVCAFSLLLHTLPSKHIVFFPLLPIFVVLLPQVSTNFFLPSASHFFSCFTQYSHHFSSFPGFIDFSELRFPHILLCIFFSFLKKGGTVVTYI